MVCTVEPVLLHYARLETFDAVREVYAVRRENLALTAKFVNSLLCFYMGCKVIGSTVASC